MRIVTKTELTKYPNGTVFMLYQPCILNGDIRILTGCNGKDYWNGELSLTPFMDDNEIVDYPCIATQWSTVDTSIYDYDDNQLFAVFSKTEIQQMINCLSWALSNCQSYFNEDIWINEDDVFTDNDYYEMVKEAEEIRKNNKNRL